MQYSAPCHTHILRVKKHQKQASIQRTAPHTSCRIRREQNCKTQPNHQTKKMPQAACLAQDVGALKKLRAGIRVSVADASGEEEPFPSSPSSSKPSCRDELPRTACLQTLRGGRSRVFLVSRGGVSVWARGPGRGVGRHPRRCGGGIGAAAAKEEGGGAVGEEGGSGGGEVSARCLCM